MRSKKFLFSALPIYAALPLLLERCAKPATAKPAANSTAYAAIDAYIKAQMQRLTLPGVSLALVEGDQIVHQRGFGRARPGGDAPTPQTPFFIGSATKSFTALAVMQLVEARKIELDTAVQGYLPWFRVADPQPDAPMTVRHLLNQTSGLPLLPGWQLLAEFDERPDATERQTRALPPLMLNHPPGAAFAYSNLNYNLLGLIIEAASGETYAAYIQRHIFAPLRMYHSYTTKGAAQQDGLAVGHQSWFGVPVAVPDLPVPCGSLPSGQLIASAEDLGHYLIAQLNGGRYNETKILSPAGIAAMQRPAVDASSFGITEQYGMGWFIEEQNQRRIIWHSGMVPDFYTYLALLPDQQKGVVLLVNTNHFTMQPMLTEVGVGVATLLAGQPPTPIRFGAILWLLRALLLIPLLQMAGVAITLQQLKCWQQEPQHRPSWHRLCGRHILLPLLPNLLLATLPIYLRVSKLRGFMLLFLPDVAWLALLSGSFASLWACLRTGLLIRTLQQARAPQACVGYNGFRPSTETKFLRGKLTSLQQKNSVSRSIIEAYTKA